MKAYQISDGEHCIVRFANSNVVARREGANELDIEFEEVDYCRRLPWADKYAEQKYVPIKALIEQGWWFECHGCSTHVSEDSYDYDNDVPHTPVYTDHSVFCTPECKKAHDTWLQDIKDAEEQAKKIVEDRFPGATFLSKDYGKDRVHFRFPGGQHSVVWAIGEPTINISKCDVDAWGKYKESIKEDI